MGKRRRRVLVTGAMIGVVCLFASCGLKKEVSSESMVIAENWIGNRTSFYNEGFELTPNLFISNFHGSACTSEQVCYVIGTYNEKTGQEELLIQGAKNSAPENIITYASFSANLEKVEIPWVGINEDGSISYFKWGLAQQNERFAYVTVSEDGDDTEVMDFTEELGTFTPAQVIADGTGNLYMKGWKQQKNYLVKVSLKTGKADFFEIQESPESLKVTGSGQLLATGKEKTTRTISCWNEKEEKFDDAKKVEHYFTNEQCFPGNKDTVLYFTEEDLYEYNIKTGASQKVLNMEESSLIAEEYIGVDVVNQAKICLLAQNITNSGYELTSYQMTPEENDSKKTEITLVTTRMDAELSFAIGDFNWSNGKYVVKQTKYDTSMFVEYEEGMEEPENPKYNAYLKDVASGEVGDIILFSQPGEFEEWDAGVFENLYDYIEKDELMSELDLNESILKLCEREKRLISLPLTYSLPVMACSGDLMNGNLLTLDQFEKIITEHPDTELYEYSTRENILDWLFGYNQDYFVQVNQKTCNFTDGKFEQILNLAAKFPTQEEREWIQDKNDYGHMSFVQEIRTGFLLGYEDWVNVNDVLMYQIAEVIFGGNYEIHGYPGIEAEQIQAEVNSPLMGICAKSEQKQGAWEFLKYMFEEYAIKSDSMYCFSVDNETMRQQLEQTVADTKLDSLDMGLDITLDIKPLPESVTEDIFKLANSVTDIYYDTYVKDITPLIEEKAEQFFLGKATAAEVCQELQLEVERLWN